MKNFLFPIPIIKTRWTFSFSLLASAWILTLVIGSSASASSTENKKVRRSTTTMNCEGIFTSSPVSDAAHSLNLISFPTYPKFQPQVTYHPKVPSLNSDMSWELIQKFKSTSELLRQNKTTLWFARFPKILENLTFQNVNHDQIIAFSSALIDMTFQAFKSKVPDHLTFGSEKSLILWKSLLDFWTRHSLSDSEVALAKYMILQVTKKNFSVTHVPIDQYQRAFLFAHRSEDMDNIFDKHAVHSVDPHTYAMQFSVMLEIPTKGTYFLNSLNSNFVEKYLYQLAHSWKDLHPTIAEILLEDAVGFLESFYQSNVFPFLNDRHTPPPMLNVAGGVKYLRFALKESSNEKIQALSERLKVLRDLVKESNLRHQANWND